jgi:hypothetical protein
MDRVLRRNLDKNIKVRKENLEERCEFASLELVKSDRRKIGTVCK